MSIVKKALLCIALTILAVLGIVSTVFLGSVVYDMATDGELYQSFKESIMFGSREARQEIITYALTETEKHNYLKVREYAEEKNFAYEISTYYGFTISSPDWKEKQNEGEYHLLNWGADKRNTLKLAIMGEFRDGRYLPLEGIWLWFRGHRVLSVICFICGIAAIGFSICMLVLDAPIEYKAFLIILIAALVQWRIILKLAPEQAYALTQMIAIENGLLLILILFYIGRVKYIRRKVKSISHSDEMGIPKKKWLPYSLKDFSNDVDEATESITAAVNERLKSDRLKTELISNVSHDLKTPLTSIINFSDLIVGEATENAVITEYAEHLHRQSIRLKDLMDALIEASKASSGAIELEMIPCKVKTLLEQCVVEYEDKLGEKGIKMVEIPAEADLMIKADARALCRIFENLLNNIYKYAMENSRAYIEVKREKENVSISFKNVSAEEINLSVDELTERFVRGDASRHSEGHGLGLSIVKSLMDLMGGNLEFSAEYDLFMVKLIFPEYESVEYE